MLLLLPTFNPTHPVTSVMGNSDEMEIGDQVFVIGAPFGPQSGGFEGLGFAATSNVAKSLLLGRNKFYLGIDGVVISGELAQIFNLPQPSAYLVEKVVFLSPGGMMGLQGGTYKVKIDDLEFMLGGDFLLALDGIEFSEQNLKALSDRFNNQQKGDEMSITILRKGKVMTLRGIVD